MIWCVLCLAIIVSTLSMSYFPLLQNSRDNMSVVLVTFPGAPQVSQEAIDQVGHRFCCIGHLYLILYYLFRIGYFNSRLGRKSINS